MAKKKVAPVRDPSPPLLNAGSMIECYEEVEGHVALAERRARAEARWGAWLDGYRRGGWREGEACTGISHPEVMMWLARYPDFRAAFDAAREDTAFRLERIADEIAEGATVGTPAQVQMIQFRLRGLKPEVYKDRAAVTVDQRLSLGGSGDGSRARLLLAEWQGSSGGGG
jgi:hypothetical protein